MIKYLCLSLILLPQVIFAQEENRPVEPYVLVQDVTTDFNLIDKTRCIELIREHSKNLDQENIQEIDVDNSKNEIKKEMEEVQEEYDKLNQLIDELGHSGPNSLEVLEQKLEESIELVYNELIENHSELDGNISDLVMEDDTVQKNQEDYNHKIQEINEAIAKQNELENYYNTLIYDYDTVTKQEDNQLLETELNQALMYSYSMNYLPIETIMINKQCNLLSDYLVQVTKYMDKLVPKNYQSVHFDHIHKLFVKSLTFEKIQEYTNGKQPLVFDDQAFEQYSYAKELNLKDIERIGMFAYFDLYKEEDPHLFLNTYHKLLSVKEEQFEYFYEINQEAFEYIKTELADYLNKNLLFDNESIKKVTALNDRYQIKLVQFDAVNNEWYPSSQFDSGFFNDYYARSLNESQDNISEDEINNIDTDEVNNDETILLSQEKSQKRQKECHSQMIMS